MIIIRKKIAAAAADNYTWFHRWKFNVGDKTLSGATLGASDGFDTGGTNTVTYTNTDGQANIATNRIEFPKDATLGVNEQVVAGSAITPDVGLGAFYREYDGSASTGGIMDFSHGYSQSNPHASGPCVQIQSLSDMRAGGGNGARYSQTISNTYDIAMISGGWSNSYAAYKSGDTKSSYTNGAVYFIKSRTGSEFTSWTLFMADVRPWVVLQSNVYLCLQSRNTSNGSFYWGGVGAVDPSADTFDTEWLNASYLDRFTDTNSTALTSHTADRGISWSGGNFDVQSNAANCTTAGEETFDLGTVGGLGSAYVTTDATATDAIKAVVFRWGDANNHFFVEIKVGTGVTLKRKVSGSDTTLSGPSGTINASTKYHVMVIAVGDNNFSVCLNNSHLFTYTTSDTNLNSNTNWGIGDTATSNGQFDEVFYMKATDATNYDTPFDNAISDLA